MSDAILASGLVVNLSPEPLLRFAQEEWDYYDGLPDRDPSQILPEDILATVAVNAFSFSAPADKMRRIHRGLAKACNRILADVPFDADIRTFDLDTAIAKDLLSAACGVRDVLLPVATKVLHRKRRSWIPMLDTVVNVGYLNVLGKSGLRSRLEDGTRAGGVGAYLMGAFRRDLMSVESELTELAHLLDERTMPMTELRILEVVIWHALEPRGYYR